MSKKRKLQKEERQLDLTPEQEAKIKKISIVGIIILVIIVITLVATILGVWLGKKEREKEPKIDPLKEVEICRIEDNDLSELLKVKPNNAYIPDTFNKGDYYEQTHSPKTYLYVFIYNDEVNENILKDFKTFYEKNKEKTGFMIIFDENLNSKNYLKEFLKINNEECQKLNEEKENFSKDSQAYKDKEKQLNNKLDDILNDDNSYLVKLYLTDLDYSKEEYHKIYFEKDLEKLFKEGE